MDLNVRDFALSVLEVFLEFFDNGVDYRIGEFVRAGEDAWRSC